MKSSISSSQAWIVLNAIPHLGPINTRRLLDHYNNEPLRILHASTSQLKEVKGIGDKVAKSISRWNEAFDVSKECEKIEKSQASFINCIADDYPERLRSIYDPPIGLYWMGPHRFSAAQPCLAIVGARQTTLYGLRIARQFAQRLGAMGFCIVSGLARGVDTAAHEGALEAGADTVAVLGNGIDIIYPPENLDLFRKIKEHGAVLSEFCFGRRADRQTFPMRNRIVSGLVDGVLVIESALKGGSMITARFAGEQGRQVYAIPGRIDQETSHGCHQLIKDGAILTSSIDDILEDMKYRLQGSFLSNPIQAELGILAGESEVVRESNEMLRLDETERTIFRILKSGEDLRIDELIEMTQVPVALLNSKLMMMELNKIVVRQVDGTFRIQSSSDA